MRRMFKSVLVMACVSMLGGAVLAQAPAAGGAAATPAAGAAAAPAAEMVDNPTYKAWASHKPGTTVVTKSTIDFAGNPNESTVTQKLVSVAADKVVVERTTEGGFGGGAGAVPQDIMAKIAKGQEGVLPAGFGRGGRGGRGGGAGGAAAAPPAPTDMKTGTDKVTIAGKTYDATTREYGMMLPGRGGGEGTKTTVKAWYSNDVPGGLLKSETKGSGGNGEFSMKQEYVKSEEGK